MRVKYPRTPHLPWSPGASADDVRLERLEGFEGEEVVVTEKLDGENTTLYRDGLHARSMDSAHHPSRTWIKALHARIASTVPEGFRVCGENLMARHSLAYTGLSGFFYVFSVWDGETALSWDDTVRFAHARGLPTPRVRYRGVFDPKRIRALRVEARVEEGYVLRVSRSLRRDEFGGCVAKWVRPHHVQTDQHWMCKPVVANGLGQDAPLWTIRSGGAIDPVALGGLVGGVHSDVDLPVLGDRRLAAVLAGRLRSRFRSELLPELVPVLGAGLARRVADLVGLAPLLERGIPEEQRLGGLCTLARSVDLLALHALAEQTEAIGWSRLVAEDAGLLEADPFAPIRRALAVPDPGVHAYRVHLALDAFAAGKLRSPEEAVAFTHGRTPTGSLTVLVGPSGCGKSTVAAQYSGPLIELDALRTRHDDPLKEGLRRLAEASGRGIWDATSLTRQQRDLPLRVAREHGVAVRLASVLTPRGLAQSRNQRRARTVPPEVVERQWRRVRWPYAHEATWVVDHGPDGEVL